MVARYRFYLVACYYITLHTCHYHMFVINTVSCICSQLNNNVNLKQKYSLSSAFKCSLPFRLGTWPRQEALCSPRTSNDIGVPQSNPMICVCFQWKPISFWSEWSGFQEAVFSSANDSTLTASKLASLDTTADRPPLPWWLVFEPLVFFPDWHQGDILCTQVEKTCTYHLLIRENHSGDWCWKYGITYC